MAYAKFQALVQMFEGGGHTLSKQDGLCLKLARAPAVHLYNAAQQHVRDNLLLIQRRLTQAAELDGFDDEAAARIRLGLIEWYSLKPWAAPGVAAPCRGSLPAPIARVAMFDPWHALAAQFSAHSAIKPAGRHGRIKDVRPRRGGRHHSIDAHRRAEGPSNRSAPRWACVNNAHSRGGSASLSASRSDWSSASKRASSLEHFAPIAEGDLLPQLRVSYRNPRCVAQPAGCQLQVAFRRTAHQRRGDQVRHVAYSGDRPIVFRRRHPHDAGSSKRAPKNPQPPGNRPAASRLSA